MPVDRALVLAYTAKSGLCTVHQQYPKTAAFPLTGDVTGSNYPVSGRKPRVNKLRTAGSDENTARIVRQECNASAFGQGSLRTN